MTEFKPVGRVVFPFALLLSLAVMFGLGAHATWQGWVMVGTFWFALTGASAWSFWPYPNHPRSRQGLT